VGRNSAWRLNRWTGIVCRRDVVRLTRFRTLARGRTFGSSRALVHGRSSFPLPWPATPVASFARPGRHHAGRLGDRFREGHRRTDPIRFDRFTRNGVWVWKGNVAAGRTAEAFRNPYPLPATELSANPNLEQNPGY
jgi:hypothetical protein